MRYICTTDVYDTIENYIFKKLMRNLFLRLSTPPNIFQNFILRNDSLEFAELIFLIGGQLL